MNEGEGRKKTLYGGPYKLLFRERSGRAEFIGPFSGENNGPPLSLSSLQLDITVWEKVEAFKV